jgi:hypothetical protein
VREDVLAKINFLHSGFFDPGKNKVLAVTSKGEVCQATLIDEGKGGLLFAFLCINCANGFKITSIMKGFFISMFFVLVAASTYGQASDERTAITALMNRQVQDWNAGNIEAFMQGYWKSDSIEFIGSEVTHGWNATLERYKRSYPDKDAMGILRFELMEFQFIGDDACLVTGKYFLTRKNDNPHGIFTLHIKKEGR